MTIENYRHRLSELLAQPASLEIERDLRHLSIRIKRVAWQGAAHAEAMEIAGKALRAANAMVFAEGSRA